MENKMATTKPLTENPSNKESANKTNPPLITKVKSPNVSIEIGRVKKEIIGLTKALINPNTTPTITASTKPATATPSNIFAAIKTAKPFNKIEKRNFIKFDFLGFEK